VPSNPDRRRPATPPLWHRSEVSIRRQCRHLTLPWLQGTLCVLSHSPRQLAPLNDVAFAHCAKLRVRPHETFQPNAAGASALVGCTNGRLDQSSTVTASTVYADFPGEQVNSSPQFQELCKAHEWATQGSLQPGGRRLTAAWRPSRWNFRGKRPLSRLGSRCPCSTPAWTGFHRA